MGVDDVGDLVTDPKWFEAAQNANALAGEKMRSKLTPELQAQELAGMRVIMVRNRATGDLAPLSVIYGRDYPDYDSFMGVVHGLKREFHTKHGADKDGLTLEDRWASGIDEYIKNYPDLLPGSNRLPIRLAELMEVTEPQDLKRMILENLLSANIRDEELHLVVKSIQMAEAAHQGQTRDEGTPYLLHPLRVMLRLMADGHMAPDTLATAALHDTLELSSLDPSEIRANFGDNIAGGVMTLSKRVNGRELDDTTYFPRFQHAPTEVRTVKVYDRVDNLYSLNKINNPQKKAEYIAETNKYFFDIASSNPQLSQRLSEAVSSVKV